MKAFQNSILRRCSLILLVLFICFNTGCDKAESVVHYPLAGVNEMDDQLLFVFPELDLIVIAQSELSNDYHEPGQQWMNTISLIMNEVFKSVM